MEVLCKDKSWRMEHFDLDLHAEGRAHWIMWLKELTLDDALKTLKKMYCRHMKRRIYTYRIRNLTTGEIIPGEIFDG